MKKILIIGATSAIASACARLWASEKAAFYLVGRDTVKLEQVANDLRVQGDSPVHTFELDLSQVEQHAAMLNDCMDKLNNIDIVLIAHGTLPDQEACEKDVNKMLAEFSNNATSVIALLTLLANTMQQQHSGVITVISSVAGDKGRASNYIYGSAKSAVTTFCEGLRARLFDSGVHVLTVKPGFVDTPMTQALDLPKSLTASPEKVATDIVKAIKKKKNNLYTPFFWQFIMLIILHLPSFIMKRLKI